MTWELEHYRAAFDTAADRVVELARTADPTAVVETTGGWPMARLIKHIGGAHRWAAEIVATKAPTPVNPKDLPDREMPEDPEGRGEWIRRGADGLLAAFDSTPADTPVWSWAGERPASFWIRRMLHETEVHRCDGEIAVGIDPQIAPDVAADGLSEWLGFVAAQSLIAVRPEHDRLRGTGETLHFHATDDGLGEAGEWMVHRNPDGVEWEHGHGKGDLAVRGPASRLLLVLMNRLPADHPDLTFFGDEALLTHWLANAKF